MIRGLGTRRTGSPDVLAMMLFEPDYLRRLIELGEEDAEARMDEILGLLEAEDRTTRGPVARGADPSAA
jgi:NTE family protein